MHMDDFLVANQSLTYLPSGPSYLQHLTLTFTGQDERSDLEWQYLLGSHLWFKLICLKIIPIQRKYLMLCTVWRIVT